MSTGTDIEESQSAKGNGVLPRYSWRSKEANKLYKKLLANQNIYDLTPELALLKTMLIELTALVDPTDIKANDASKFFLIKDMIKDISELTMQIAKIEGKVKTYIKVDDIGIFTYQLVEILQETLSDQPQTLTRIVERIDELNLPKTVKANAIEAEEQREIEDTKEDEGETNESKK